MLIYSRSVIKNFIRSVGYNAVNQLCVDRHIFRH